jgi:hypothetical protein
MAKQNKKTERPKEGNNIQLDYTDYLGDDMYMDMSITLMPKTPISIFGDHTHFIWEGNYGGDKVSVSLPRSTPEEFAEITGLPNKHGLNNQVIAELKRILRQLN